MKKILLATVMAISFTSMEANAGWPFGKKTEAAATQAPASAAPAKPSTFQRIKQGASAVGSSMKAGMAKVGTSMKAGVVAAGAGISAAQAKVQSAVAKKPWVDAMGAKVAKAGTIFESNINAADAAHEAAYANAKTALGITFIQSFTKDINALLASPKVQLADKADYLASLTSMIAGLSSNAAIAKHLPGVVSELEGVRAQAYNQVVSQLTAAAGRHMPARSPAPAAAIVTPVGSAPQVAPVAAVAPVAVQAQAMVEGPSEEDSIPTSEDGLVDENAAMIAEEETPIEQ